MNDIPICTQYNVMHGVLGLYISNRCNIRCEHCGVNSGPEQTSHLDISFLDRELEKIRDTGPIRAIHVSGGEPFLFPEDLSKIGRVAESAQLAFAVNSNAFWARDVNSACEMLRGIHGLTELLLSADVYHESFLPIQRVVSAACAGKELGLHVAISVCTPTGKEDEFTNKLKVAMGPELAGYVPINTNPVEAGGRATNLQEANWRKETAEFPQGACRLLHRPVVVENGDVLACCNTTVYERVKESPLVLGNVHKQSLVTILNEARKDRLIQSIRILGPGGLANLLADSEKQRLGSRFREGDICSVCVELMSRPQVVRSIQAIVQIPEIDSFVSVGNRMTEKRNQSK